MEKIRFRCNACKKWVEKKIQVPKGFAGWAYSTFEWLDPEAEIPPLDEQIWPRRDTVPRVGEICAVKVSEPFDEDIGAEFCIEYLQPEYYLTGVDTDDMIERCAILKCRLESVISSTEYNAWVNVKVLDVIMYPDICKSYPEYEISESLEVYGSMMPCGDIDYTNKKWRRMYWTAQGDIDEYKTIYTDEKGREHMVLMDLFVMTTHETFVFFGNIVQREGETS